MMFNKNCSLTDAQINEKSKDLLSQMTLKEKVWLLNGNWDLIRNKVKYKNPYNPIPIKTNGLKRLNIKPVAFTDGPRGVVMGNSTCFPVSMARGASFDRALERKIGDAIGKEARAGGANYFGGVCINLLRHPAWGRAQETYSEDPFHLGEMGKALTESVQEHNVMACLKHYAVNNIENTRFKVNVKSDERTLREVYLPHFKKCVDAGAASIMGAYNKYDGDHCCESRHLLTDILRDEWKFEGFTISDFFFGVYNTKKAIEAGLDIEMPMPIHYQRKLLDKVKKGEVEESVIDTAALRVIKTLLVFDNTEEKMTYTEDLIANKDHIELAREAAEKSMVLIKNKGDVLPFKKSTKKVLILGDLANKANTGDHGSSRIYAPYVVSPLEGFKNYFGAETEIIYCETKEIAKAKEVAETADCVIIFAGNDFNDEGEFVTPDEDNSFDIIVDGYKNQGMKIKSVLSGLLLKSVKASYTTEDGKPVGGDRQTLSLKSEEITMIKEAGRINPNTSVVLIGGSMIMTKEWDNIVPSILYGWYSGMEGGNALPRVLFGDVNPSGKLPFTIPEDEKQLPYFSSKDLKITYDLYHGYTLLDKNNQKPMYPFGFGLSYTGFEYSDIALTTIAKYVEAAVTVSNTGKVDGEEVVQVYVGLKDTKIDRQKKLLKGFDKVFIKAGESKRVTIQISIDELKYYSNESSGWVLEKGVYQFYVGSSSSTKDLKVVEMEIS
jgi:beta-glucosidase